MLALDLSALLIEPDSTHPDNIYLRRSRQRSLCVYIISSQDAFLKSAPFKTANSLLSSTPAGLGSRSAVCCFAPTPAFSEQFR